MNKKYGYPGVEDWEREAALVPPVAIERLVEKLNSTDEERFGVDDLPEFSKDKWADVKTSEYYHYKTGCFDDPSMVEALKEQGIAYESKEMGATRWLVLTPMEALEKLDKNELEKRLDLLFVFHQENYDDPYWACKTLKLYDSYLKEQIEKRDRTIIFIVVNYGSTWCMFHGMITEGIQNYCGSRNRVLIDVSNLEKKGIALKDIPGFDYVDENGASADPDAAIEKLGDISVINFSGRWVTPWRAHRIDGASDGTCDAQWMIHSELGRKLHEDNLYPQNFRDYKDPGFVKLLDMMGLELHIHHIHEERWVIFTPQEKAIEKLPVVVCLDEVNEPDDHSIVAAFGNYEDYCRIAAQGDCAVIFFAMEDPRWNDWIAEIVQDAAKEYPIDLQRVYMTGHSHNGHFTQEFARRNPKVVAAIAPLGNAPGLPTPAVSHEAVAVDDARAKVMESQDMPTCILCGCKEVGCLVPINEAGHAFEAGINVEGYGASAEGKIEMWNRRLKAERIPQMDPVDVMAAKNSPKKAVRELGFPCDRTEVVYIDGLEHYVADLRNVDGNYHFRVVAIENMPHMTLPSMHQMAWNYMKRFARNLETGEVIELE